jgi:hypothetical protein
MMQIRDDQNRADDVLVPAPGRGDVGYRFVPPQQPIVQDTLDHEERNEHDQNQPAHAQEL